MKYANAGGHGHLPLLTDSYKVTQHPMYPEGTTKVHSYLEARNGGEFQSTLFFGLQYILTQHLIGRKVTQSEISEADKFFSHHLGPSVFNRKGWQIIVDDHDGRLPLKIWAIPEGKSVPNGTPMMAIENTDDRLPWLTNYLETLLLQVWYPSTVATLSKHVHSFLQQKLLETDGETLGLESMLHDFGCRGATSMESAGIGGAAHLVNFVGTDTVPALRVAEDFYGAELKKLGFSIPAAEHAVMTSLGAEGELDMVEHLLDVYPAGLLAAPIDSYDYIGYISNVVERFGDRILARDGKFVFRPDSISQIHPTPHEEMVWILHTLYDQFGGTVNNHGYKILDPHVGVLWGDGLGVDEIEWIVNSVNRAGFATSNLAFGMGGGLLQKVNRDTQKFAFKCSAQERYGEWCDVHKSPSDKSKASKAGRQNGDMNLVFEDGHLMRWQSFEEIRGLAR